MAQATTRGQEMDQGIKFNDNGTISFPIGEKTYTLKRPTTGQFFDFWDLVDNLEVESRKQMIQLRDTLSQLKDADEDEMAEVVKELRHARRHAYEYTTIPWLRDVFAEVGSDKLPDDLSEAPSEITDPGLISQILEFWRTVPLAHSPQRRGQLR